MRKFSLILAYLFYLSILPWRAEAIFPSYRAHNIASDNGVISGFDNVSARRIGSPSFTDNGYFGDLITKGPWIDVRAYGAVGNSTTGADGTDDATGIQAALTGGAGGTVLIPEGGYRIDTALTMSANTRLIGLGQGSKILINNLAVGINMADNCTIENLYIGGLSSKPISAVGVSNIRIVNNYITGGTRTGTVPMAGIYLDNVSFVWIEDDYLYGNGDSNAADEASYGIVAYTVPSFSLKIHRVVIRNSSAKEAIALFNTSNSDISNNDINQGNIGNGTNSGRGIMFYRIGDASNRADNNTANFNLIRNAAGSGIYAAGGNRYTFNGNIFIDVVKNFDDTSLPAAAIALNGTTNVSINGGTVDGSGKVCLSIASGSDNVTATGIQMNNCGTRGTHLRGTLNGININGIGVTGAGSNCLEVQDGKDLNLSNNTFLDCANNGMELLQIDNSIISTNRAVGLSNYGIHIAAGAGNKLTNNNTIGSATGVNDAGSDTDHAGNRYTTGATAGKATLVNGTATVSTAEIVANDQVLATRLTGGGTSYGNIGIPTSSIVPGTSFYINSYLDNTSINTNDNSVVYWEIRH